jgi:hypothetical protein
MKQYVFEVLEEMSKQRNRKDKVRVLKENESWALKDIIRGSMDTTVVWNLPIGEPPYTAATAHSHPANLLRENVKFQYFVKGGAGDKMTKVKITNKKTGETFEVELEELPENMQRDYKRDGATDNSANLKIIKSEEI